MIDKETAENLLGESKTELVDMLCNMSFVIDDYEAKEKAHKAKIDELKEYCEELEAIVQKMKCCENCESWRRVEMGGELQNFGDCTCNVSNIPRTEGITQSDFYCKYYAPKG